MGHPFTTMTPEMQQWLMQQMQQVGQQPQQGQGMQPLQPSGAPPQMPRLGGNNALTSTGTAVPRVGGIQPAATPPREPKQISGRGAFGSIIGGVMAVKQKMSQDKQQKARAIAGQYIAMMNSGDPKLQQAAQQLLADPKNHKIFDKAISDPTSPEYNGVQQAYQDVVREDQQKAAWQQLQQQMSEAQARMVAEQQRGKYWEQMGEAAGRRGEVTPEDRFKAEQKAQQIKDQIAARKETNDANIAARRKNLEAQIASLEKRTSMQQKGAMARTKERVASDQAIAAMLKQYKNIEQRYSTLDREQTTLEKEISDKPVGSWLTGEDDAFRSRISAIDAQRKVLDDQMDQVGAAVDQMTQGKLIPKKNQEASAGKSTQPKIHDFSKK
jgi:hypothetical protein